MINYVVWGRLSDDEQLDFFLKIITTSSQPRELVEDGASQDNNESNPEPIGKGDVVRIRDDLSGLYYVVVECYDDGNVALTNTEPQVTLNRRAEVLKLVEQAESKDNFVYYSFAQSLKFQFIISRLFYIAKIFESDAEEYF
ncbi:MAG: hypothetical protein MHMPM18_004184 [Marteilia pararefringens]